MEILILEKFTLADWNAFIKGYAGNPSELIEEIRKNPELYEDDINGAAIRRANIKEDITPQSNPINGDGFFGMMNHN